jgi:hypothetical protein
MNISIFSREHYTLSGMRDVSRKAESLRGRLEKRIAHKRGEAFLVDVDVVSVKTDQKVPLGFDGARAGTRSTTALRNAVLVAIGATVWCGGANGMPSCQGTYAATLLQPLPERVVVELDIRDRSKRNLMLGDRFLTGMREAGVVVGQDANVLLRVTTSLGEMSPGAGRGSERNYSELGGLAGGGKLPTLPAMPMTGMMASRSVPAAQPLLVVRVDATADKDARIAWVASMQCRMTGSDEGQLARELGRVIGGALGTRVERQAF